MKRQKYIFITFSFICLTISFSCSPIIYATSLPTFAVVTPNEEQTNYKTEESSIQTSAAPQFNFSSKAQVLMEQTTGNVIYANNEMEQLSPASVTKIMTILLIMDAIDSGKLSLTDTVTCSANASSMGGSQIWFKPRRNINY